MIAHQPEYINTGHFGEYADMNPSAITVVIVGVGADDEYILNNQNEVYEHCSPCPVLCHSDVDAYIQ